MEKEGIGALTPKTVIEAFEDTLTKYGSSNALNVKRDGEW
jgi:hypothetical protein